ncbi:MAG: hypothetical protein IT531_04440 [Burkholderiales bacterium]|nr:hypothetical protein [Burkholderiales bacterium]
MKRLIRDIGYFAILCLMIVGMGGVIYHAIGKDGWIERFLGGVLDQGLASVAGILIGLVLGAWLIRRWLLATQRHALFNDFLMYGMVALGVLFIGRLLLHGTF